MTLLLDPQIIAAVVTVLLTALAGAGGYYLRERIARNKPFLSVITVDGDTRRFATRIEIPKAISKPLIKCHLLNRLTERAALPDIEFLLTSAKELRDTGPDFCDLVSQFSDAANSNDFFLAQSVLAELLEDTDHDGYLTTLVGEQIATVQTHDANLPILVVCNEEPNFRDGVFSVGFPGRGTWLGSNLNTFSLYKTAVGKFVHLIERMELKKIADTLNLAAKAVTKDIAIANEIIPHLQEIVDKYSQWSVRVYLANLGETPILVQQDAMLNIVDSSGGRYQEVCSLLIIKSDEDGQQDRFEAQAPLIVRSEADVTFEFVTNRVQSEMPYGDSLRALFRAGSAKCTVDFSIERPGMKKMDALCTSAVIFKEP